MKPRLATQPTRLQALNPNSWRNGKETSAQRGYGYKWQKAREGWLRAHPKCVMCDEKGILTAATVVDHKTPHRGDQDLFWNRDNWQSLCKACHDGEKRRQENQSGDAYGG